MGVSYSYGKYVYLWGCCVKLYRENNKLEYIETTLFKSGSSRQSSMEDING